MSNDSINILKYMIVAELALLICAYTLGGYTGLILAVFLSIITVCFGSILLISNAAYAPSESAILKMSVQVALLFTYLGVGVAALFSSDRVLSLFSYVWLASVVITVVTLFIVSYRPSELSVRIKEDKAYKKQQLLLKAQQKEQAVYEGALFELGEKYKAALADVTKVDSYIVLSEAIAKQYKSKGALAYYLANYATKFMIKYTSSGEYNVALSVFDSYVDCIVLHVGLSDKSFDVASNAIVLSAYMECSSIFDKVTEYIFGENINVQKVDNNLLHFNLACHYALKRDKTKLILHINLARIQGKSVDCFLNDDDFNYYMKDKVFLYAIHNPQ